MRSLLTLDKIRARCAEVGNCWIWSQGLNANGQPNARHGEQTRPVRRVVFELLRGRSARKGWFIVATCGHKRCVSPECVQELDGPGYMRHLNLFGFVNNAAHHAARTVAVRRRSSTKLTLEKARQLSERIKAGEDRGTVAADFGVSRGHANRVARGQQWTSAAPANASVFKFARSA